MNRATPWLIGAGLVLAAGLVSGITPPEDSLTDAFPVHGSADQVVTTRTLVARVVQSSFAERLSDERDEWDAEGNWLVIEIAASARQSELDAEIGLASLLVDGRVFHASERLPDSLLRSPLRVGVDTTGLIAFELPASLRSGTAQLRLSAGYFTPSLDDVIMIPIDLEAAERTGTVELTAPKVGTP